jgi:transposase
MIMALFLFLYNLTEFRIGKALKERNETVPKPEKINTKPPSKGSTSSSGQSKSWCTRRGTIVRR